MLKPALSLVYVVESLEIAIASFIFAAFLAGLSATLPSGPIFAMTVTESAERGFLGGLMVVVGHALVERARLYIARYRHGD